jgi:hypothetical protein
MPAQDCFGSHDGGKLVEYLAAEDLAFDGEPTSLVIVEEYSFLPELLPEYVILSEEEVDGVLLVAIDPSPRGSGATSAMAEAAISCSSGCAV